MATRQEQKKEEMALVKNTPRGMPRLNNPFCTSLWLMVCASSGVEAQGIDLPTTVLSPVEVVSKPVEFRQFERVEITGSSIIRK